MAAKPAAYSNTDTAEVEAVNIVQRQLDGARLKCHVEKRDKVPNSDGYIELVDAKGVPVGKLEVQVKALPGSEPQFDCPTSLVAYSETISQPFFLLCVDREKEAIYWKHLHSQMEGYKENQDTFRVRFIPDVEEATDINVVWNRWKSLIDEYRKRVSDFPLLKKEYINRIFLEDLSLADRVYFQRFIARFNELLSQDFITIKRRYMEDVWQFGVGITSAEEERIGYHLYKIPFGQPAPLITQVKIEKGMDPFEQGVIQSTSTYRKSLSTPESEATQIVLDHVKKMTKNRHWGIGGVRFATDLILFFLDKYAICVGLKSGKYQYNLRDVDEGFVKVLPQLCGKYRSYLAHKVPEKFANDATIAFLLDDVSTAVKSSDISGEDEIEVVDNWIAECERPPIGSVGDAIQFLLEKDITVLRREWKERDDFPKEGPLWLWVGYSKERERENIEQVFLSAVEEYREFVRVNKLSTPR